MATEAQTSKSSSVASARGVAIFVVLGCVALALALAWGFARVLAPERRAGALTPAVGFDRAPMRTAMSPNAVAEQQARLLALGSRYLGQPGVAAAESEVRHAFTAAGLELTEQPIRTLVPRTIRREITLDQGSSGGPPLGDVEVYPLMPNHLQPVVTPAGGLTGRLLVLDRELLATAHDLRDVIGILDAGPGGVDPAYQFHWARYARLGVKAIIVAHRGGLGEIDWNQIAQKKSGLVSSVPVNFVRLAATPGIFAHVGQRLRLDVRVEFQEAPSTTLIGVLRASHPASEALVIAAPYDAGAVVPDLAPGALPALQTAWMLQALAGLEPLRQSLRRDVVFFSSGSSVMGEDGLNQLLRVLQFNSFGGRSNRLVDAFKSLESDRATAEGDPTTLMLERRLAPLKQGERDNREQAALVRAALRAIESRDFLTVPSATRAALERMTAAERRFFDEQLTYVLNGVVLERQEIALAARLAVERQDPGTGDSPEFRAYRAARGALDTASALASAAAPTLLEQAPAFVRSVNLRERCQRRFEDLARYHAQRLRELAADERVATVFSRYRTFDLLKPSFVPATAGKGNEVLTLFAHSAQGTQSVENILLDAARGLGPAAPDFRIERMLQNQTDVVESNCQPWPLGHYSMLYGDGYQGIGLVNFERQDAYQQWASPVVRPFMLDLGSLARSFQTSGELVARLAHGEGILNATPGWPWQRRNYGGRVLAAGVGQGLVPSYPLAHAVVGARSVDGEEQHSELGYWRQPFYATDPYGRFDLPEQTADFPAWWRVYGRGYAYTPVAVGYGSDGAIAFMKDEGDATQGLFKSVDVPMGNEAAIADTTIVTFRAAPVTVLDLTNPQDFKDYSGIAYVTREGLSPFESSTEFAGLGFFTTYLPPDRHAKVLLQSGVEGNDRARVTRAFMLGPEAEAERARGEAAGRGYLIADHPFLLDVALETGRSMARVNGQRLALQNHYGMADARTNRYHQETLALLRQASDKTATSVTVNQRARDAVSYAGLDHPVLRRSVGDAVVGILFYLGLLVPFMVFAEKLLFAATDARRQLAGQGAIFLATFGLLRLLHPAFELVRSPLMILLGFVIVLVTSAITLLFSSKASAGIAGLTAHDGKPAGAEVSTLGVFVSSLLLGLNNMHRRRVRTGLTCATITLLTFVMICFTSTQTDVVDRMLTLGPAGYQGLLIKHDDFVPLSKSEVFALDSKFGARFPVVERRFFTGAQDWNERKRLNPTLSLAFDGPSGKREVGVGSILKLAPSEPLREKLRLLTRRGWFRPEHVKDDGTPCPVLLPDRLAERIGLDPARVDAEDVLVSVNGKTLRVWGIFESASLDALRDLDGRDLLPFDIERVATASETTVGNATVTTAKSDDPRIPGERMLVTPVRDLGFFVANGKELTSSVAVALDGLGYREARHEVDAHLEKTALPAYYGLDGVAFRGQKARELTLAGLVELLLPLVLAALTVLNTMRGSVYERRGEIQVYNAVGIAPRYVFAMFLAEALVYVVIGAMLGYLLSQGIGRALRAWGLTGGLPMTFTSLSTVYATLAIALAVMLSTWFPARDAMRIAAPADESGWRLPDPVGDELRFDLPFTFRPRARIAVLAFFERWFSAHGEGGAGAFSAGIPALGLASVPDPANGGLLPELLVTLWLKPFDLAVSQRCVISMPFDTDTGEFTARLVLTRSSGTREAWLRLNRSFVAELRRHFLHWRAVGEAEEAALFLEARHKLETSHPELGAQGATA